MTDRNRAKRGAAWPRRLQVLTAVALMGLAAGFAGCSVIADSSIASKGLGASCRSDNDCQGSSCHNGVCVLTCQVDSDCPATTKCFGNQCHRSLSVGGIWVGVVSSGEGWTWTHHEGMEYAKQQLPFMSFSYKEQQMGEAIGTTIDELVRGGGNVVISNSFDHVPQVLAKAKQHKDTKFLSCAGHAQEPNVGAYYAHAEQAWYVAGQLAARKTKTRRLGFIGSYVTPEVVRHINAFARGAKSVAADVKVEVRWLGFWYDPSIQTKQYTYTPLHVGMNKQTLQLSGEEYLTAKLIDSGVDVIGHQCDNQIPSRYVATHALKNTLVAHRNDGSSVYVIANNNRYGWRDVAGQPLANSFGAVYFNWGPTYVQMLTEIHRGGWKPFSTNGVLRADAETSPVGFELSTNEVGEFDLVRRQYVLDAESEGPDRVFAGPFSTNGNERGRDMAAGEVLQPEEYASMCWFVDNVIERSNPNDPKSADQLARVPGLKHPGKLGQKDEPKGGAKRYPTTAPEVLITMTPDRPDAFWNCRANQFPAANEL